VEAMGCGGSKPEEQPPTTNTRTNTRQNTAARPSGTAQQHTSARKHTSGRQPSSHRQSRSGHRSSSRDRPSNTRHRAQHGIRLTTLEEQPEDVAISDAVRDLATIIENHSRNYYPRTNTSAVGKEIGQSIVNDAIMSDDGNVGTIANQISKNLRGYQPDSSPDREAHLHSLVEEGRRIHDTMAQHRSNWSFGAWDEGVKFPRLLKNGVQVTPPRR